MQQVKKCIILAGLLVESTVQVLKDDKVFQDLYSSAKHFADINVANKPCSSASRPKRVRQMPQNLEESIVYDTIAVIKSRLDKNIKEYKEVIDKVLQEMKSRFDATNKSIMKAIQALLPTSANFFVEPFANHCYIGKRKLEVELPPAEKIVLDQLMQL